MTIGIERYRQIADETAVRIASSGQNWMGFLNVAAQLYKYDYSEQLLIYAQRPNPTACASAEIWNQHMHRYIRRGAKGIALLEGSGESAKVKYVFDIADTWGEENARTPTHWSFRSEHVRSVSAALQEQFYIPSLGDFAEQLQQIGYSKAVAYYLENQQDFLKSIADAAVAQYSDYDKGVACINAVAASITYTLFARCDLAEKSQFGAEDFAAVLDFNTPQAVSVLGTAVSTISGTVLRSIELAIKQYERRLEKDNASLWPAKLACKGGSVHERTR